MAGRREKVDDFYRSVLNKSHKFLIEYLDPVSTLDAFITEEFLQRYQVRDIQELRTTSEKNREILEKVKSKGRKGYAGFIKILRTTRQDRIVEQLKKQEHKMAAAIKSEATAPAQHPLPAILAKEPTEKDLLSIADAIGYNWEMLAPHFISENSSPVVDHIKMENPTTVMQIYKLLLRGTKEAGHLASFGYLFFQMQQVGPSVTINWNVIAKYLSITLADIRACKDAFNPSSVELPLPTLVTQQQPNQDEEEMEVIYNRTDVQYDGQSVKDETDAPSLSTKRRDKEYRPPKDSCIFDGRLLKLEKRDIESLKKNCTELIGTGGFGKVFTSKADLEEFGMRIAVKKIPSGTKAATRERITSRILHPFILPLLAVVDVPDEKEVWFISPYCENKDLHDAIQKDYTQNTVRMNQATRIRILLQIALALEYIHTKVLNVRDTVLHKDISSKNVVLDYFFNARLIDFGLAREKNDATTRTGGTLAYLHPDYGKKKATESWDYFAFGVVIREMLTGIRPEGDGVILMKFWEMDEVQRKLQKKIWPLYETKAYTLNRIAATCLKKKETKDWTVEDFKVNVVDELYKTWHLYSNSNLYATSEDYSRCHMCIINPVASKSSLKQDHDSKCTQKIATCMACEKNSFLNPIRCYCERDLKPSIAFLQHSDMLSFPDPAMSVVHLYFDTWNAMRTIGHNWGALLVAGNDTDRTSLAEALTKDLKEIKKLITSKAPLIMGISEENVRIVVPDKPGKQCDDGEKLSSKVKREINYFSSVSEVDTLLIYFSCHGIERNGSDDDCNKFKLGSEDKLTQYELEKELESLKNKNLLVILDRCFPLMLNIKDRKQIVQINACKQNKKADFNDDGSTFTKYFIQGLKARSEEKKCSDDCKYCDKYWSTRDDFISVESLFSYVKNHMEKDKKELVPDRQHTGDLDCLAYYTDEVGEVDFTCNGDRKNIPLRYLKDMSQLEDKIFEEFKQDKSLMRVKIKKNTFRKEDQFEDCDTLEKVMLAWAHRQPLEVGFEAKPLDSRC